MKYNGRNLKKVLEAHKKWLAGDPAGSRANFTGTDLYGINLFNKNLSRANFTGADLSQAYCRCADFTGANFTGANLSGAHCPCADFTGADFTGAIFNSAINFEDAIFSQETKINYPLACPKTGNFTAYKASTEGYIVELLIPEDAKRSSATGKQCRCDKAKVISIQNPDGSPADDNEARSQYDFGFVYRVGETVSVPDFDECRWHECAPGIHFFMDRKDAVDYLY